MAMNTSPDTITLRAGCKVNLYLEITGRLDNGYHTLKTLFYPLPTPHDTLTLTFGKQGGEFTLSAGDPELESDSNTIAKAWKVFTEQTGFAPGLSVKLDKGIPMGAGLGGGSADAAAVLRELNTRAGDKALPPDQLNELAASIGADVPFFLLDGPAWAEGIGEELHPVNVDLQGLSLVLICPPMHVSSAWAYHAWDKLKTKRPHRVENTLGFLTCAQTEFKNSPRSRILLHNSFEDVVFPKHHKLLRYKEKLLAQGACGAVLSGSGASLLGLFRDSRIAEAARIEFKKQGIPAHLHCL
ncbi:4-diphosphocytidyl-2-C-methyl-D-erythritol kinase [Desulfovibrio ferrophilus]|uniref:4-diphosphocytidyl-2-C-methyl-D-erythritol kinase n=2 Tax=Desulfovibrio ferrophilus TaxID=241368 RepID=A0A2Z6AW55_9BACT|nr:4-diphosphocytidyl-2-C-methyl-D-erythritol kinase [Desulfovibrio ferrophilus]